jgi:hypothetical protein
MTNITKFSELNLDSAFAAAVIATGLAFAWFGSDSSLKQAERIAAEDRVTVSQDDARFHVTVTAQRPRDFVPAAHQAAARPEATRT